MKPKRRRRLREARQYPRWIGEAWVEVARRRDVGPPLIGVAIVDTKGIYVSHRFEQTRYDKFFKVPISGALIGRLK